MAHERQNDRALTPERFERDGAPIEIEHGRGAEVGCELGHGGAFEQMSRPGSSERDGYGHFGKTVTGSSVECTDTPS